jgi:hypothetical protein
MSPSRGWRKTLAAGTYHKIGALVIRRMKAQNKVDKRFINDIKL